MAINPASVESHDRYCEKKGFGFPILSDTEGTVASAWQCLKTDGKGIERTVYALDPDGRIIFAEQGQADYKDIMACIRSYKKK